MIEHYCRADETVQKCKVTAQKSVIEELRTLFYEGIKDALEVCCIFIPGQSQARKEELTRYAEGLNLAVRIFDEKIAQLMKEKAAL